MKRAPTRGGEVSLLIASGILVIYGGIMTLTTSDAAIVIGLETPNHPLGESPSFFNAMWLFASIHLLYVVLGLTLRRGFRPLYFLTIGVVTAMFLYHGASLFAIREPAPFRLVAVLVAVNLMILMFVALGYREVESGTAQKPFWQMLRDRRSPKEVVCPNCGSHSIQEIRPGEGQCNFCGKVVSFPVGG